MRLDGLTYGLLTCLWGLAAAQGTLPGDDDMIPHKTTATPAATPTTASANSVVVVASELNTPLLFSDTGSNQSISFEKGPGISDLTISHVNLKIVGDDTTILAQADIPNGDANLTNTYTSEGTNRGTDADDDMLDRRRQGLLPPYQLPTTSNSVTIVPSENLYRDNINKPLYLEFEWQNSTSSGKSYSSALAVYNNGDSSAARGAILTTGYSELPVENESFEAASETTETYPASAEPTESSAHSSSGGGNALSPGAIAGIAVGCAIAGLLIIGLVAWFFFFRRRRNDRRVKGHNDVGYASDAGTQHAMIHDKEAPGVSESSPHSLYAEDGGRLHDPTRNADADAVVDTRRGSLDPPYAPYSDPYSDRPLTGVMNADPNANANNSQTDLASTHSRAQSQSRSLQQGQGQGQARGPVRSPTPPITSRYAHLVEEGMTEDEIRRLDEEERHLDAAIEDAGRGSHAK